MTDKQFNDAFTAAGGWFIDTLGFDAKRTGSNTRVSSVLRLISENRIQDAIIKVRDSNRINAQHPGAFDLANDILKRHF